MLILIEEPVPVYTAKYYYGEYELTIDNQELQEAIRYYLEVKCDAYLYSNKGLKWLVCENGNRVESLG